MIRQVAESSGSLYRLTRKRGLVQRQWLLGEDFLTPPLLHEVLNDLLAVASCRRQCGEFRTLVAGNRARALTDAFPSARAAHADDLALHFLFERRLWRNDHRLRLLDVLCALV